ncbi:MAG: dienelactone hydrolase family protein [Methanothrix sp.]
MTDTSNQVGTWYFNVNGGRLVITLGSGSTGTCYNELYGTTEVIDNVTWNISTRILKFRWVQSSQNRWWWIRGKVVEGIFVGRAAIVTASPGGAPASFAPYTLHATAWNSAYIDSGLYPRVFEMLCNSIYWCMLRIDQDVCGNPIGQFKVYSRVIDGSISSAGEELEYDVNVIVWDGTHLEFIRYMDGGVIQHFIGTVSGRYLSGSFTDGTNSYDFSGFRTEILAYGLRCKTSAERAAWQDRVRTQLEHLMMAENPTPILATPTVVQSGITPVADGTLRPAGTDRDDDIANHPQAYTLTELNFEYIIDDTWYNGSDITRLSHGFMAIPTGSPPSGGWPAVIVVNGHGSPGSNPAGKSGAWRVFDPNDGQLWYGDAWARRGYVVLAIDISHRDGSFDAAHGNVAHPAIVSSIFAAGNSDWEQDGERAWDVMQAITLLLVGALGVSVNADKVFITGLSLGGEVTTYTAAFDTRLKMAIPAGFTPDLRVMANNGNCNCYQWVNASIWEYLDLAVLHALIAPRPLIVQTGIADNTFASIETPFSSALQVMRRSGIAYNKGYCSNNLLIHYLQSHASNELVHQYRCGDKKSTTPTVPCEGLSNPEIDMIDPCVPKLQWWMTDWTDERFWQVDTSLVVPVLGALAAPTLFDYVDYFLDG